MYLYRHGLHKNIKNTVNLKKRKEMKSRPVRVTQRNHVLKEKKEVVTLPCKALLVTKDKCTIYTPLRQELSGLTVSCFSRDCSDNCVIREW